MEVWRSWGFQLVESSQQGWNPVARTKCIRFAVLGTDQRCNRDWEFGQQANREMLLTFAHTISGSEEKTERFQEEVHFAICRQFSYVEPG